MFHDFISLADLTTAEILGVLELADNLKRMQRERRDYRPLAGQTLAMIFEKPSLRTRVTFETGIFQLGGQGVVLHSEHIKLGERESVPDVARNLDRWVDGIMARTFSHDTVLELARWSLVPVINALTDKEHPCQVLAAAQALSECRGGFEDLKVVFVGDGNNVCASWVHLAARLPIHFTLVCPEGYEPEADVLAFAKREAGGRVSVTHDLKAGLADADAVYTDVWVSMGQEAEQAKREKAFADYQVNSSVMALAGKDAVFMHCLPARRGSEVTDEVMDGPQSVVFDEAENRLHTQKAIMVTLMARDAAGLTRKLRARKERGTDSFLRSE